jgi:hypothetical protein
LNLFFLMASFGLFGMTFVGFNTFNRRRRRKETGRNSP